MQGRGGLSLVRTGFIPLPPGPRPAFDHADVSSFRCSDGQLLGHVEVGPHPNGLAGRLFCALDGGALVVLDADSGELLASLALPGVPDVLMHDPERRRLYVAIGDPGLVASFDSERLEHVETIETELGAHTSCRDPVGSRLYVFYPASCGAARFEDLG